MPRLRQVDERHQPDDRQEHAGRLPADHDEPDTRQCAERHVEPRPSREEQHVRDLPAKDGSVRPDEDFEMSWEVDSASAKRMNDIADAVKKSDGLFLATDPDREGEAISWHVLDILKKKKAIGDKPVKRVVFNAITKKAVLDAMAASTSLG